MPFDATSPSGQLSRELLDRAVDEAYLRDGRMGAVARAARKYGLPVKPIYNRAQTRGLAKIHSARPWTEEEHRLMEANAQLTNQQMAELLGRRGYPRTLYAVRRQRQITNSTYADTTDHYNGARLAELLSVSPQTVGRWCRSGLLKATRRLNRTDGEHRKDDWLIHWRDARRFLIDHPLRWRLAGVDQLWLIDILARRGGGGQS